MVLGIPDYEIATEDARNVLPERIPLKDAVSNLQRIPLLVDALNRGKLENLDDLMQDSLHQPYRKSLIKGFDRICASARAAGASGVALSGAGPTIAAFCTHEFAHYVVTAMSERMEQCISHQTIILSPDMHGTIIEKRK